MTRKILLDGNANDRPSLPFAIFLCLIPITTFFYMKRRQRNRYNQVPGSAGQPAPPRGSRTGEPAGDAGTQKKEKDKIERDKKKWEDKVAAEKKKTEEEKQKRTKAEQTAEALEQELMDAQQKIRETRYKLDLAEHPNDPFLDDQTPDEVFNRVKPLNPNPNPPAKPAVRNGPLTGQDPGNPLHPKKGVDFTKSKNRYEHPVTGIATLRKDGGPGIAKHDISRFVPRDQKENAWSTHNEEALEAEGLHLCNDRYKGIDHLRSKTDELKEHLPETTFAIFQKASNIAYAQKGSAEYGEAMVETRDNDHGVYPSFASAPIGAIVGLITDNDVMTVLSGMLTMKTKIKRKSKSNKDPENFIARYCLGGLPDKATMPLLWYLDSFRVVSSLCRMNIIRGEPKHLEKTLGLKFILFEWLEIFGIQCAQQRLLSPAGFDLAGLCIRLHCLPVVKEPNELRLIVTIYLPGGADRVDKKGEKMEYWETRMHLAVSSWREVWGFLSTQTGAEGREWGHGAFKERELVFSPGFTFEGIKQAGGPPTEASPDAEPNNRYDPILNALTPTKGYPYPGQKLINYGHGLVPMIRPTTIVFKRRRQFTWAHTSLTKTSHNFEDGMIALCLETIDPRHWIQGRALEFPDEINDDNLEVRLQNDDVKIIKFNSTIPMTLSKKNKPIGFPDVTVHPKLDEIYMTYVAMTRQTDGNESTGAKIPATATLILASELGLWSLLHRIDVPGKAKKVKLYVDIKGGDVQQFADELMETLIGLGKKKFGAGWSGNIEAINRDAKEDRDVLRQVYCQLENDAQFPISQRISGIAWDSN